MRTISPMFSAIVSITAMMSLAACSKDQPVDNGVAKDTTNDRAPNQVVNLYSARHYDNDLVIFKQFTDETGIKVNLIEGNGDALIERISSEGDASPADLFVTADAGILWRAQVRDLFQRTDDDKLNAAIPASFRHPDGQWFGLTKRARVIVFNREAGLPDGMNDYEDLANPAYKNMVCVRPSSNIYNQSLLASIIANNGQEAAEQWAAGVVANFARKPQGNDTAQIEAVAAGLCRVAIVNSYYAAKFYGTNNDKARLIGENIDVFFPNQGTDAAPGRGSHVNISGGGILANAPNPENALALLQFLVRKDVQANFASGNNEYPVRADVSATGPVTTFGTFREDSLAVTALGENQRNAVEIFDRVGWQ